MSYRIQPTVDNDAYGNLTFERFKTLTGILLLIVELTPNCPKSFFPQHFAEPLSNAAQECFHPTPISLTLLRPTTVTGTLLLIVELSPNCPESFCPQHLAEPLLETAQV